MGGLLQWDRQSERDHLRIHLQEIHSPTKFLKSQIEVFAR